ncbi:hypothetical protein O181_102258 [Austropuccinia psidii MF-1]|uniref:Uncharacterized protein n=1 Tax=Austropuccinia psidii MF-1 TaxID=1389203 RepID=A0A9Q3JI33_9BASI|nr:hypothetical protein [Austropuccinia psidii MF-1]
MGQSSPLIILGPLKTPSNLHSWGLNCPHRPQDAAHKQWATRNHIWLKGPKWPYIASRKKFAICGKDPKDLKRQFGPISSKLQGTIPLSKHAYQEISVQELASRQ